MINTIKHLIVTCIISVFPFIELRGAIPYALINKINPLLALTTIIAFNILLIFLCFLFLDYINEYLMKIKVYKRIFEKHLNKAIKKMKDKEIGFWILFLFVFLPLPGTGAYTGILLSWFFKMDRKKSLIVIISAMITSAILITFITLGGIKLFN